MTAADKSGTCPACDQPVRLRTRNNGYGHQNRAAAIRCLNIRDAHGYASPAVIADRRHVAASR